MTPLENIKISSYLCIGQFLACTKHVGEFFTHIHLYLYHSQFDILPTNKFGGFRYHQPMPLMKARSYLVYFAGRCPALCSYELFKFGLSVRTTLECRYYRKTLPLYLGVVADLRGRGGFLAADCVPV